MGKHTRDQKETESNKTPLWVIQSNLGKTRDIDNMIQAIEKISAEARLVPFIPFSDELPNVETDRPVIFYGSARVTKNVSYAKKWIPGVFQNDAVLNIESYNMHWKENMINFDAKIVTVEELSKIKKSNKEIFVQPTDDNKSFAGSILTQKQAKEWSTRICEMNDSIDIDKTTKIIISEIKNIITEWRCFLHQRKCITASQYRSIDNSPNTTSVPKEVVQCAEKMYEFWPLLPVVAIDIGLYQSENTEKLGVIEAGSVHSTGFYEADIAKVVQAVTKEAVISWENHQKDLQK